MTLLEIKDAVNAGKKVHWANEGYRVWKCDNDYYIVWNKSQDDDCISLTWKDGVTLNGDESEFFIGE